MSTYFFLFHSSRVGGGLTFYLVIATLLFMSPVWAGSLETPTDKAVVFIDPGHGGEDMGARGATGLTEKEVVFMLAKRMVAVLDGAYTPGLSRHDDYHVDINRRIEIANNQKADLFISLHTGGSFRYTAEGIVIYYFLDSPGRVLPEESYTRQPFDLDPGRVPWHGVQYRHASESRLLARAIQTELAGIIGSSSCRVRGAPLLALSAADMPAVLIEIGCLNNPIEETNLRDPEYLSTLTEAIATGIDNFVNEISSITVIDLHE